MNTITTEQPKAMVDGRNLNNARVVLLKSGTLGPSLFLVPGSDGRVESLAGLVDLLQTRMAVYGLKGDSADGSNAPDNVIDELVTEYLSDVRLVQKAGPYFFLGYSFGGMIAYEIAQRLHNNGEKVASLILLDTVPPTRHWPLSFRLAKLRTRLPDHARRLLTNSLRQTLNYYLFRLKLRFKGIHESLKDFNINDEEVRKLKMRELLLRYWNPKPYSEEVTLFYCTEARGLPSLWRRFVARLDAHFLACGHLDVLDPPYVRMLSDRISGCLMLAAGSSATVDTIAI